MSYKVTVTQDEMLFEQAAIRGGWVPTNRGHPAYRNYQCPSYSGLYLRMLLGQFAAIDLLYDGIIINIAPHAWQFSEQLDQLMPQCEDILRAAPKSALGAFTRLIDQSLKLRFDNDYTEVDHVMGDSEPERQAAGIVKSRSDMHNVYAILELVFDCSIKKFQISCAVGDNEPEMYPVPPPVRSIVDQIMEVTLDAT